MNKIKQCMEYVNNWYIEGYVMTVAMDATTELDDYCIQCMVVELLKDFIENPVPEGIIEGSPQFNTWIDFSFRKVMQGLDFGFTTEQEDAVKNLAWNYWADGVNKVIGENNPRVYKCKRRQSTKH